jgi:hypothetical protein
MTPVVIIRHQEKRSPNSRRAPTANKMIVPTMKTTTRGARTKITSQPPLAQEPSPLAPPGTGIHQATAPSGWTRAIIADGCHTLGTDEGASNPRLATACDGPTASACSRSHSLTEYLAPILIGIALWRSRSIPRWLAILFAAGFELAEQTASIGPAKVVLLMAPFAVAMILLSIRIWNAPAPSVTTENQQTNRV